MNLQSRVTIQLQSPIHLSQPVERRQNKEKLLGNSRTSPNLHSILKTSSLALGIRQEVGRGQRLGDVQKWEEASIRKHRCLQHQELNVSFKKEREIISLAAEDRRESFNPGQQCRHKCHRDKGMTGPNKCISIILFLNAPFNEGCHLCSRDEKQQITWSSNSLQSCYGDK